MEELRQCDTSTLLYLLMFKEKSKINPVLSFWLDQVDEFEQVAWVLEERLLHSNADLKIEGGN
ncbi:MAG: hypothetical protein A3B68_03195 [Candidatus Melainabacteria bacterium RIFCSPHIGHO2_02_FULL_34_12]|nr:MAG: hypothetical protein A3B68_03195 [Candidatus Melainabacteria bacterium RIFCSPHIGHO2_02_FULL_34_12]